MNVLKPYCCILLLILAIAWLQNTGCKKEYSYEGGDTAKPSTLIDTLTTLPITPTSVNELPACALCAVTDNVSLNTWSFTTGNSYVCGGVANAGFIGGKTTFTFFGPSACSQDTGLVMTVYLPVSFDEDRSNITTSDAAYYYYDNGATKDIFIRQSTKPFSVTVQSFSASTEIATGTFEGTVFKANGDTAFISNGRFKVKLK